MAPARTRTPIYEEWDDIDGIAVVVVGDEAFLPAEYDAMAKTCQACHRRFLYHTKEQGAHRPLVRYCSDACTPPATLSRNRAYHNRHGTNANQPKLELAS